MPAYNGRIAIAGVAESDYGRVPHMTEMQLHAQALQRVLVSHVTLIAPPSAAPLLKLI